MNLRNLSVRTRLAGAFGFLTVVLVAASSYTAWGARQQAVTTFELLNKNAHEQAVLLDWQAAIALNLVRAKAALQTSDVALGEQLSKDMKGTTARIDELQQEASVFLHESAEKTSFEQVLATRKSYSEVRKEALSAKAAGASDAAQQLMVTKLNPAVEAYQSAVQSTLNLAKVASQAHVQMAQADADAALYTSLTIAVAVILLALLMAWRISRSITLPLERAVAAMTQMAQGDLRVAIQDTGQDEPAILLRAIQTTVGSIGEVLRGMQQSSESVMVASRQIASGNIDLSARTESQASQLQQSAAAVEKLSTAVTQNASVCAQARTLTTEAESASEKAATSVTSIEQTMLRIQAASAQVADFVTVINDIAFQTNILALNAAVEAARAGAHGRGFAVVASEVRNLAQRSAESAREIRKVVAQTLEQVEAGVLSTKATSGAVQAARDKVEQVSGMVAEIAGSSQQQAIGLREINGAISGLDNATQQNSALVEESAAAAESLSEQARQLSELSNRFQLPEVHA